MLILLNVTVETRTPITNIVAEFTEFNGLRRNPKVVTFPKIPHV